MDETDMIQAVRVLLTSHGLCGDVPDDGAIRGLIRSMVLLILELPMEQVGDNHGGWHLTNAIWHTDVTSVATAVRAAAITPPTAPPS